jgi:hypothetical protein
MVAVSELRELFRYAHIALAVTVPTLCIGAFVLRDAGEVVLQAFAMTVFFLGIALLFVLVERDRRRRQRGQ